MLSAGSEPGVRSRSATASGRAYAGWDIGKERDAVDGVHPADAAFLDVKGPSVDFDVVNAAVGAALGRHGRADSSEASSDGDLGSPVGGYRGDDRGSLSGSGIGGGEHHRGEHHSVLGSRYLDRSRNQSAASGLSGSMMGLALGTVGEEAEGDGTPSDNGGGSVDLRGVGVGREGREEPPGLVGAGDFSRTRMFSARSADSEQSYG